MQLLSCASVATPLCIAHLPGPPLYIAHDNYDVNSRHISVYMYHKNNLKPESGILGN